MRLSILPWLVGLCLCHGCDVFVAGAGGVGEQCLDNGLCQNGLKCNEDNTCEPCSPDCTQRECGSDGCGGSCGTCSGTDLCLAGRCEDVFLPIPGGDFQMGSTDGADDEKPVHTVSVADFRMSKTEVTVEQYRDCVAAGVCTKPGSERFCNFAKPGRGAHPVNCVDWEQASTFCAWVGGRLPSEAEWEYAARSGGREVRFPWGDTTASCQYAVMFDEHGGYGCGQDGTAEVCGKPAGSSEQGLCDLSGNVWEWVEDRYHNIYTGAPVDGSAWTNTGTWRVVRGGSFNDEAARLRTTARFYNDPSRGEPIIGFRCVK